MTRGKGLHSPIVCRKCYGKGYSVYEHSGMTETVVCVCPKGKELALAAQELKVASNPKALYDLIVAEVTAGKYGTKNRMQFLTRLEALKKLLN